MAGDMKPHLTVLWKPVHPTVVAPHERPDRRKLAEAPQMDGYHDLALASLQPGDQPLGVDPVEPARGSPPRKAVPDILDRQVRVPAAPIGAFAGRSVRADFVAKVVWGLAARGHTEIDSCQAPIASEDSLKKRRSRDKIPSAILSIK